MGKDLKGKKNNRKEKDEPHGIRLPGSLLDEIKISGGNDGGIQDADDNRYSLSSNFVNKKGGKGKPVSRKEARKTERQAKKKRKVESQKVTRTKLQQQQQQVSNSHKSNLKSSTPSKSKKSVKFSSDTKSGPSSHSPEDTDSATEEFEDDDDVFDSDDFGSEFEDEEDQPQTAEDTMAALMAMKKAKNAGKPVPTAKESKKIKKEKKETKPRKETREIDPLTESLLRRDNDDIKHYAKLLGMKSTSVKHMKAENDGLDDLLEGLDFLDKYGSDAGFESEDYEEVKPKKGKNKRALSESESESEDDDDFEGFEDEEDQPQTAEDTMAALMALKAKKNAKKEIKIVKEDDLQDDDISDEDMDDDDEEDSFGDSSDYEDLEQDADAMDDFDSADDEDMEDFQDEEDQPQTVEDTMAALKALKAKKASAAAVKVEPAKKEKTKKTKESKKDQLRSEEIDPLTESLLRRDEDDIKHYAKLLGMKSTKVKDMKAEGDGLDDLFEGLDFLDQYDGGAGNAAPEEEPQEESEASEEESDEEEEADGDSNEEEVVENPFSSDDEINSSDFDESFGSGEEDGEEEEDGETIMAAPKENPYAPAVSASSTTTATGGKYIPPALRAKLAEANGSDPNSAEFIQLKRQVKGPLNKLSESNTLSIISEILSLYQGNARQLVTEAITAVVLDSVKQQGVLLDTFVVLHAALMAGVYRVQGVEAGAYFIQSLIEEFETTTFKDSRSKEAGNLVSLICGVYSFGVIGCKLVYGIIKSLLADVTELNSELLLRIIRNCGPSLRSDDPSSLRDIVIELQKKALAKETNSRTKFLIETVTNLKNNKSKIHSQMTIDLIIQLKKQLSTIKNTKFSDPLQVSLDDIHSVATKGKWWVVGSAWRNNLHQSGQESGSSESEVNVEEMQEILDSAEPNWVQLAKDNRMNTDIRRAIFITIVSSQDYIDAFTKLDKLRLKRSQEREIPKILLHCVGMEGVFNPYYGLLGNKLCQSHAMRKSFQFCLWDLLKEFEGDDDFPSSDSESEAAGKRFSLKNNDDEDEDTKLKKLVNLGKFYGSLISEGSIGLHALKDVNFVSLNEEMTVFLEVLMIQFLDLIGKKSELSSFGSGNSSFVKVKAEDLKFKDDLLIQRIGKCDKQKRMLMGLQWFLQEKVRGSDIISGRKQRKRVEWGCNAGCDVIGELVKRAGGDSDDE